MSKTKDRASKLAEFAAALRGAGLIFTDDHLLRMMKRGVISPAYLVRQACANSPELDKGVLEYLADEARQEAEAI